MTVRRISFWVSGKPKGYDRDTAVYKRLSADLQVWRSAIQFEYLYAARVDRRYDWPTAGNYVGRVGLILEMYGTSGDWDNLGKEVSDALERFAYKNDKQVVSSKVKISERRFTKNHAVEKTPDYENPGVVVTVVFFDAR